MAAAQRERFDVAVVGGGFAGIAAAVSAAECGARTLLVESADVLGGNAAQAFVHTVCGLYLAAEEGDAVPVGAGFAQRFAAALQAGSAAGEPERAGKVWVLPTEPLRIPAVATRVCAEAKGLEVRLGTPLNALVLGEGSAAHVLTLGTARRAGARARKADAARAAGEEVEAALVIDTSGDACAAALAGAACESPAPGTLQLPSYIFRLGGVGEGALVGFARMRITHAVTGGVRSGSLPQGCESVLIRPGGEPGTAYVTLNLPRPEGDAYAPLDAAQLAKLEREARRHAQQVAGFLRARPEFADSKVDAWPRKLGVREARRIVGRATLVREDVLDGREHPGAVARSSWPIELWQSHRGASFEYPQTACDIPLDALVSATHARLGAAGRCLSASHEALGALRVLGTALATGEAVGVAAALAAEAGTGTGLDQIAAERVRAHIRERAQTGPTGAPA